MQIKSNLGEYYEREYIRRRNKVGCLEKQSGDNLRKREVEEVNGRYPEKPN